MIQIEDREFDITIGQATNIVLNSHPDYAKALANPDKLECGKALVEAIKLTAVRMIKMRKAIKQHADSNWVDEHGINLLPAGRYKK